MIFMLQTVMTGGVLGAKAHRWLGYAQGMAVMLGLGSLELMKSINERAKG